MGRGVGLHRAIQGSDIMRGLYLAAAAAPLLGAATLSTTASTPARADGMPFCISGDTAGGGSSVSSCNFVTYRQCERSVRNTGGSCVRNPYYAYGYGPGPGAADDAYAMMPPAVGPGPGYTVVVPAPGYIVSTPGDY